MSCYLRHITDILDKAGISITKENRQGIDRAVHQAVDIVYKNCPVTWKTIKSDILNNPARRLELIAQLRATVR